MTTWLLVYEFPLLTVNVQHAVLMLLSLSFYFFFSFSPYGLKSYFVLLNMDHSEVFLNLVVKFVLPLLGSGCGSVHVPVYLWWLLPRISLERFAVTLLLKRQLLFFSLKPIQNCAVVTEWCQKFPPLSHLGDLLKSRENPYMWQNAMWRFFLLSYWTVGCKPWMQEITWKYCVYASCFL